MGVGGEVGLEIPCKVEFWFCFVKFSPDQNSLNYMVGKILLCKCICPKGMSSVYWLLEELIYFWKTPILL